MSYVIIIQFSKLVKEFQKSNCFELIQNLSKIKDFNACLKLGIMRYY